MKKGGFLILLYTIIALNSCDATLTPASPPPVTCKWQQHTIYVFDVYLQTSYHCITFADYALNSPFVDFCDLFERTSGVYPTEIVWKSIGNTCSANTMNGPTKIITSTNPLVDCIGFEADYDENVVDYTEHELTIKIENVEDLMYNRTGAIVWHKLYTPDDVKYQPHLPIDVDGCFIPYDGERLIYVHNNFTNF